ncbi:MAG: Unknown protein [uncultured Sulfurovum sp.]|uniref:CRISPR-associated RAMP Cmr1 n=1 Tax=uncultured Sulfurovum sp. TaxID=269237 RepID=A0A6S6T4I6_9BACT|nr:MAG: Unknown protein [uncultured Sulfurovum sp.]
MSKFKATFSLKQHTPIIHFQSEQSGATLRATELKPKFDRFLIKHVFNNEFEQYKKYLIGYKEPSKPNEKAMTEKDFEGKKALDYKVRIVKKKVSDDKVDLNGLPDERLFMGNMGGGTIQQIFHRNFEHIVTVNTFNKDLKVILESNFSDFIFQTNFGGGTSKGFGSFSNKEEVITNYPENCYSFKVGSKQLEAVYNSIYYFYKMLKSGINEYDKHNSPVFYGKSFLWLYVNNTQDNMTWEKKKIKEFFFKDELKNQQEKYPNSDILASTKKPFLYRDLLGLSLESDWMSYDNTTISKKSKNIARFPSPIIFKPVLEDDEYIVYFWGVEISKDILNKTFTISNGSSDDFDISTPETFDISKYLEFVSKQNVATHIDSKFQQNNEIFKTLQRIFNSMQKVEQNSKGIS